MEDYYKEKYDKLIESIKVLQEANPSDEGIQDWVNDNVPELKRSEDEKIRKDLIDFIRCEGQHIDKYKWHKWIAWLEKQGEQINLPQFTFDDVLALQCCMETVKKVQEDKKLYEALLILHNKVYDAYHLVKQDEQKPADKEYTFKAIPRLLDMIEPSEKVKYYCQKLIDTLKEEGYNTDAKIVGECLKGMNGEKVAMATMDDRKDPDTSIPFDFNAFDSELQEISYYIPKGYSVEIKDNKVIIRKTKKKQSPKFKVGDWISGYYTNYKVLSVNNDGYLVEDVDGNKINILFENEKFHHLWSIADAKDGDVLYLQKDGKEHIIIYKGVIKESFRTFVSAYCAYNGIVDAFCFADVSRYVDIAYGGIMPATKEQCELLFRKMEEAGYEWDAEKKELKKIESSPDDLIEESYQQQADNLINMVTEKSTWSEEDEKFFRENILIGLGNIDGVSEELYNKIIDWVNLIKKRLS